MSLLTYEDARPWARAIRQKVVDREMPPWDADPAVGAWANDRSLSDEAIAVIAAWADGGAPRGDRALQPRLPAYADSEWTIGEPDAVFAIPPFEVPPEETVDYTYFEVPTDLTEDKWVTAVAGAARGGGRRAPRPPGRNPARARPARAAGPPRPTRSGRCRGRARRRRWESASNAGRSAGPDASARGRGGPGAGSPRAGSARDPFGGRRAGVG